MDLAVVQGVVATTAVLLAGGFVVLRRPPDVYWPHLLVLELGALIFVLGDLGYLLATEPFWLRLWLSSIFTGVLVLSLSWVSLVTRFAHASEDALPLLPVGVERALYAAGAGIWLLMVTDPWHHQFVEMRAGSRSVFHWGFWVHACFSYGLMVCSLIVLGRVWRRLPSCRSKTQITILTTAPCAILTANMVHLLSPRPMPLDVTVGGVGFSAVLFIFGFYRAQLFDLTPMVLREVVRRTRDCVLVVDESFKLRYANPAAREVFGHAHILAGSEVGALLSDRLRPTGLGDARVDARSLRAVIDCEDERPRDHVYRDRAQDRYWSLRAEPIRSPRGKLIFRSLTLRDVTLQIRAEQVLKRDHEELEKLVAERTTELSRANDEKDRILEALADSEARYRALIADAPLGVIACNRDGDLIAANARFWRILDLAAPMETESLDLLAHGPLVAAGVTHKLRRCITSGERQAIDFQSTTESGRVIDLRLHAEPLWDSDCRVQGVQAILEDVTERAQAKRALTRHRDRLEDLVQRQSLALEQSRDQLRRSERLSSIGILAAGVAHQINNPIGAILGAAEYALCCRDDEDAMQVFAEALEQNVAQATRCGKIVRSLLQFSRGEATPMVEEDVAVVVQRACYATEAYARSHGGRITTKLPNEALPALLSPIQIEQVLVNVIRNAVESREHGVAVEVSCERVGNVLRISIHDDGAGIDPEVLERVFDPFFTTRNHEGGTGLGLSVAHGIVLMHGGAMRAESEVGQGTTFTIELPARSLESLGSLESAG